MEDREPTMDDAFVAIVEQARQRNDNQRPAEAA